MRVRFASSTSLNWHGSLLNPLALIVGWLALTTVIIGSFLRGYVKRQKKPLSRTAPEPSCDKAGIDKESQSKALHTLILQSADIVQGYGVSEEFNDSLFDREKDYAQVLAEARMHIKEHESWTHKSACRSTSTTQCKRSQQTDDAYWDSQSSIPKQNVGSSLSTAESHKSAKIWKHLLFWQQPKKAEQQQIVNCPFSTPQHPSFRRPRGNYPTLKRGNSGPIYTDGLPTGPSNRCNRPLSGPLGAMPLYGQDLTGSSYEPLQRSSRSSSRAPSGPLYSVS